MRSTSKIALVIALLTSCFSFAGNSTDAPNGITFKSDVSFTVVAEKLSSYFSKSKKSSVVIRIDDKYQVTYIAPAMDAYAKTQWHGIASLQMDEKHNYSLVKVNLKKGR